MILFLCSGLPGPCKAIVASDITKSSCKVTWDPPDYDGGSPILHYVLQVRHGLLEPSGWEVVRLS